MPANGQSGFWLERSTEWQWADGTSLSEAERLNLLKVVPQIGVEEGWSLELDEGPRPTPLPITSLFEFKGQNRLVWTSEEIAVVVPGRFSLQDGRAAFVMDMAGEWTRPDGQRLSLQEVDETAQRIQTAAPANGVVITTTGQPQDAN
jgi:hypothetical protein